MNWYYMDGDQQQGPVGDDVIKILVQSGKLGIGSLVRTENMSDWWTADQAMLDRIAGTRRQAAEAGPRRSWKADDSSVRDWEESGGSRPSLARLRIGAACVDLALIFLFGALCSRVMATEWFGGTDHEYPWRFTWVPGWVIFSLVWLAFCKAKGSDGSPGQLVFGIRATARGDTPVGFLKLAVRWLASWGVAYPCLWLAVGILTDTVLPANGMAPFMPRLLILAVLLSALTLPLLATGGRRSLQDLLSGCTASLRFEGPASSLRRGAAAAMVISAVLAQGYDVVGAIRGGWYKSDDGGFSVWLPYPGTPETEMRPNSGVAGTIVGNPSVAFSALYCDLPDGGNGFNLQAFIESSAPEGAHVAAVTQILRQGIVGCSWRVQQLDGNAGRFDVEEHWAWVAGSRIYRLVIAGPARGVFKIPHTTRSLFLNSFRFWGAAASGVGCVTPGANAPQANGPSFYDFAKQAALFGMATPWQLPATNPVQLNPQPPQPYSDPF